MAVKYPIPADVVNRTAYYKFIAYQNHPTLRNKMYTTSEGEELSLGMLPHRLRGLIKHLSPKEQEVIMEMKRKYNSMLMKKNSAKATAYGRSGRKTNEERAKRYTPFEGDVVELLGRMFTVAEVVKILGEDDGIAVDEDDVREVMKNNLAEIERKREEFRNKIADVRLYNKRPRLEELAWMYSKMKARYISLNGIDAYTAMLRTLEQIRKESEGDILNVNGALDVNVNMEINAHLQKEVLKTINLKEIILGRVASRMNYDTSKLIAGLHNSYYNRFVHISGDFDPNAEISYPSLTNYDFGEIERRNAERNDIVDVEAEPIEPEESNKAQTVKEMFLAKIRKQREDLEKRTSTYVDNSRPATEDYEPLNRHAARGSNFAVAKDKVPPSKTKGAGKKL